MTPQWRNAGHGGVPARLIALFAAIVMLVAMVGPGVATYGSDKGHQNNGNHFGQAGGEAAASESLTSEAPAPDAPAADAPAPAPQAPVAPESTLEAAAPEAPAAPQASTEPPVAASAEGAATVPSLVGVAGGCSDGNPDLTAGGVRIDAPPVGVTTYTSSNVEKIEPVVPADFWIKITSWEVPGEGWYFDFESNYAIAHVVAKGGNTGYLEYFYDPAQKTGYNLHCPANPSGTFASVSHLDFYFDDVESLTVYKFQDDDQDETWDDGVEDMLEDWFFTLYNDDDEVVATDTTDGDGMIVFDDLEPGDYYVTETLQDGWDNTTALTQYVTIEPFGDEDLWFGNVPEQEEEPGDLVVYKFQDDDRDTTWDEGDEDMLESWEFKLYRGNYFDDVVDTLIDTDTTNALGKITWLDLEPGQYYAIETLQDEWENTTMLVQHVTVVSNDERELWFGNVPESEDPELGDVIIHKFEDLDEDEEWDAGEPLLSEWEFSITGATTPPIVSAAPQAVWFLLEETDENGEILVEDQPEGTVVSATETLQDGWRNTTPLTQSVEVEAGETKHLWFGNVRVQDEEEYGDVIIHKFSDDDMDQVWDEGVEDLLEDWQFTVAGATPLLPTGLKTSAVWLVQENTDSDGEIVFEHLPAGTVITATETMQEDWDNTTPITQSTEVVANETVHLWFGNVQFARFTELDLAILKSVDDRTVDEGQLLTYTLTYWNNMDDEDAYDYTIVDDYDERYLTIVDAAGGVVKDGKITWTFAGPLAKSDGKQTITYTARVRADMPDAKTNIDNVVRIWDDRDKDPTNNQDDERVVYEPDDPFLPFTGGEYLLLIAIAVTTGVVGLTLRLKPRRAA